MEEERIEEEKIEDNIVVNYTARALEILQGKDKLCFEGGGVLGYAYAGAMIRLRELGGLSTPLTHAVGSSVGSIASIALAAGATPDYIKVKILSMDLRRFKDGGNLFSRAWRLITRYGSHKGDEVEKFVGEILHDLTGNADINFQQLFERTGVVLTVPYVSTRHKRTQYANHLTEPFRKVKEAARWSSTIPLFFQASRCVSGKSKLEDLMVDGGVTDNYPIHILRDQDQLKVLGFKLINTENGPMRSAPDTAEGSNGADDHGVPRNVVDYIFRLVEILREQALRYHVASGDWKITCKIDVGRFTTTSFDISEADKQWLYNSGVAAVDRHLAEIETLLRENNYVKIQ